MTVYLNTNTPLENFKELFNEEYFVDKSMILEKNLSLYLMNGIIFLVIIFLKNIKMIF
ncbi:MAG: hypothetical protein MSA89_09405 [Clostridium sp.]|nr:hypothetical protein [Clostridium sp.]